MKHPERIRIATWNCFGAPPTAEDFFAGRCFWPERLASPSVALALRDYDVVCVQENLVDDVRQSLERLRVAAGFEALWFDPMGPDPSDNTFCGGGLAILSRFPIQVRFERLPRGEGPDGFARKGFATADIVLPSGRVVHVVNTHLQADDPHVSAEASRRVRTAQVKNLAAAIGALKLAGGPVIICGDFNVAHGTDEYDELRGAMGEGLSDLGADAGLSTYDVARNDLAAIFHTSGPERALIDYIWAAKSRFEARDVRTILDEPCLDVGTAPAPHDARAFASDHFGLGATLHLVD